MLEILGSIINGFALPLKAEHKQLVRRVLLPMHAPPWAVLKGYHQMLADAVGTAVRKDAALVPEVLLALAARWPRGGEGGSEKQLALLDEAETVLAAARPSTPRVPPSRGRAPRAPPHGEGRHSDALAHAAVFHLMRWLTQRCFIRRAGSRSDASSLSQCRSSS